jgi:hypothetical protein
MDGMEEWYKLGDFELDGLEDELSDGTIDILGGEFGEIVGLNEGDSVRFLEGWDDGDAVVGKPVGTSDGVSVGVAVVGNVVGCFELKV